jgi:hypothetical protein
VTKEQTRYRKIYRQSRKKIKTPIRTKKNQDFQGNKTLNHMEQKIEAEQNFEPYGTSLVPENGN